MQTFMDQRHTIVYNDSKTTVLTAPCNSTTCIHLYHTMFRKCIEMYKDWQIYP